MKNFWVFGGRILVIIFCISMLLLVTMNYIILKNYIKQTKKSQEKRLYDAMSFYLLATQLKYKIRSGWDKNSINAKEVAISGVAGGILSLVPGAASGLTNLVTKVGTNTIKTTLINGAIEVGSNAVIGSATSVITDVWVNGKDITDKSVWQRAKINGVVAAGGSLISSVFNNTVGKSISDKILKNKISEDVYRHSAWSQDYDMGALAAWKNSSANIYQNSKNFWSNVKNWYDINLNWIMNVETQMVSNSLTQKCSFND